MNDQTRRSLHLDGIGDAEGEGRQGAFEQSHCGENSNDAISEPFAMDAIATNRISLAHETEPFVRPLKRRAAARPRNKETIRVLFASSEISPLAKTGGLADVSAALPAALADLGIDMCLVMPAYEAALDLAQSKQPPVPLGDIFGLGEAAVVAARTPDSGLPLWLIDCPALFRRPGGLYVDSDGRDWADNAVRFALFSHVVARLALGNANIGWQPDVVHVNDWHLGLVPALLASRPDRRVPSLLTIHNLAFQGIFPADVFPRLGLPDGLFTPDGAEFYGQVSFLKAGIRFADRLSTVSSRYAQEVMTAEFGCGLDGLLRARADDLIGILNGIDCDSWTPDDSVRVPFRYNARDLSGKRRCKTALQGELGLDGDPEAPLIGYVSRLTEQKMADVLPEIAPALTAQGAQLAICGEGDRSIERALRALETQYPRRIAVRIGYDEPLARRLLAGADMLAAPARFEPCGLIQMYAMRFGTVPIVPCIGGLGDTVVGHEDSRAASPHEATGIVFDAPTAAGLSGAVTRACRLYGEPIAWRRIQAQAMRQDFSWRRPAGLYLSLLADLVGALGEGYLLPRSDAAPSEVRLTGT
jgi:starch synthase